MNRPLGDRIMRTVLSLTLAAGVIAACGSELRAADTKEVTLKGTIQCAKCALKEKGITKCTTAIVVKEGDKSVTYFLDDKGSKEDYHEMVCGGDTKEGTVVGTVSEKDGKKWVKPTKVDYKK
jgi:hypothetical protein